MSHFMGLDGNFVWFFGTVVDRLDPLCLGRVRVRVFGIHPDDKSLVPDHDLPWAIPVQPITSAAAFGIGGSPVGPVEGTQVFGFFADGRDCQIPIILGTIAGGLGHFALNIVSNATAALTAVEQAIAPTPTLGTLSKSFAVKAGPIGLRLMQDLNLTDFQAAGILGNIAHESGGCHPDIREGNKYGPSWTYGTPLKGYGWVQWTNPRGAAPGAGRLDKFIDFVKNNFNGYDIQKNAATDDHNYAYLLHELKTTPSYLKGVSSATSIETATAAFMNSFEKPRASVAHLDARQNYAKQALQSMHASSVPMRSTAKNTTNG